MNDTRTFPSTLLEGVDLQAGDTLHVIGVADRRVTVRIEHAAVAPRSQGPVSEWLESARGSIHLPPGETVDDLRMAHLEQKYGLLP